MKLSKREKYSVYIAAASLCLFVLIQFIISPLMDKKRNIERTIRAKTEILKQMKVLKSDYESFTQKAALSKRRFAERKKGFTLFSFLDRLAGATGIKDHITYMKPSTSAEKNSPIKLSKVEMKIQAITMKQLVDYLHHVETSENMVTIKRLSISTTGKREGFLNAVLQVETYEI